MLTRMDKFSLRVISRHQLTVAIDNKSKTVEQCDNKQFCSTGRLNAFEPVAMLYIVAATHQQISARGLIQILLETMLRRQTERMNLLN